MKDDQDAEIPANPPSTGEKKGFMLEYERPTQLYRILHHRHQSDPAFLYRNINYQRSITRKKKIDQRSREEKCRFYF